MKIREDIKITSYTDGDGGWHIAIVETGSEYEAWLQYGDVGVSILMFGVPKERNSKSSFITMVAANADEYKTMYWREVTD